MSEDDGRGASSETQYGVAERDERLLEIRRAHRRLQHLYDIGRLLACFESVERSLPEVMAAFDEVLALDSAVVILDVPGSLRTFVWGTEADGEHLLRSAKVHAQVTYRNFMRSDIDLESGTTRRFELSRRGEDVSRAGAQRDRKKNFVILPLALERGGVLGALQIEGAHRLGEQDLAFMGAVVNELAIAVDRCVAKTARTSTADAHRLPAPARDDASFADYPGVMDVVELAVSPLVEVDASSERRDDSPMQRVRLELDALNEARSHARARGAHGGSDARRELARAPHDEPHGRSRARLDGIHRSAERMNSLFSDMIDTAAIEASRFSIEPALVAVDRLVGVAVDSFRPRAAGKSLSLVSEVEAHLRPLYADAGRIEQVLARLLSNAVKFAPHGGTVTVRAQAVGDEMVFSVGHDGAGIPERELPHLFDPMWQAEHHARAGSGLGLFIVKGIVEAHSGRIWVESASGRGSTFSFALPAAVATSFQPTRASRSERSRASVSCDPNAVASTIERRATLLVEFAQGLDLRKADLQTVLESKRVARELARRAVDFRRDLMGVVSDALRAPLALPPSARPDGGGRELATPGQQRTIRQMFAAMRRLTSLIQVLVEHALVRGGRLTTANESCSAGALAADVLDELRPSASAKGLGLTLRKVGVPAPLRRDPALVRLVLLNLVEHAIKSTDRGLVEVVVDCDAYAHRLAVLDSGPGIPAAERVQIFEPFVTAAGAERQPPGLALSLVREVTSALGGHVEVASRIGPGNTFTVTLPRMAQEMAAQGVAVH